MTGARLGAAIAGTIAALTLASPAHADRLLVGVLGDVATVDDDGSDYSVIVTEGNARHPSWSPDGKRIAYMRDFDLWVADADGTDAHEIVDTERAILGADWSPTGRIFYADVADSETDGTIWSVADDGTDRRRVTDAIAHDGALDVSPDGTRILFGTHTLELTVVRDDGTERRPVLARTVQNGTQPAWSPDGTRIAYLGCPPGEGCGNNDIWTMDTNGGSRTRLTTGPQFDIGPEWSADGKRITYSHFETEGFRLRVMEAGGADDHQVSNVPPGALYAEPQPPADEDLDGIRDDWETNPADVDGNGTVDLDLPAMGADPRRKDLFLELDFMPPHRLAQGAVDRMELAFAAAPVPNPMARPESRSTSTTARGRRWTPRRTRPGGRSRVRSRSPIRTCWGR